MKVWDAAVTVGLTLIGAVLIAPMIYEAARKVLSR